MLAAVHGRSAEERGNRPDAPPERALVANGTNRMFEYRHQSLTDVAVSASTICALPACLQPSSNGKLRLLTLSATVEPRHPATPHSKRRRTSAQCCLMKNYPQSFFFNLFFRFFKRFFTNFFVIFSPKKLKIRRQGGRRVY